MLCGRVHFKVESDGRSEAHVAAAKAKDVPGQFQFFEQALNVVLHFFKGCVRVFRFFDADDFHFVELVQTVEAAYVFTVGTGFATEAGRVCTVLLRKILFFENHVTVDVGHRNFGSRNQVEVVEVAVVHLSFLVRKLSCTVAGCLVYNVRRLSFQIACF